MNMDLKKAASDHKKLKEYIIRELGNVSSDLEVDSVSDEAFIDYIGDHICSEVSDDLVDRAIAWCKRGGKGEI